MKKKFINLFNVAFLILQVAADIIYMVVGNPYMWKTFASLTFFFGGLVNFIYCLINKQECSENKLFKYFMVIGLFFAMLGDIVLIDYFIFGAGLFAVGHIWFFIAYCSKETFKWKDVICSAVLFLVMLAIILFVPIFEYEGIMLIVVIVYAFIISIMLGKAIMNYAIRKLMANLIIMIGSILFFLSDFMLLFDVFGNVGRWADRLCLIFYYPAEYLLAISIFYASKTRSIKGLDSGVNK